MNRTVFFAITMAAFLVTLQNAQAADIEPLPLEGLRPGLLKVEVMRPCRGLFKGRSHIDGILSQRRKVRSRQACTFRIAQQNLPELPKRYNVAFFSHPVRPQGRLQSQVFARRSVAPTNSGQVSRDLYASLELLPGQRRLITASTNLKYPSSTASE